jgi:hypothetical protein
VSAVFSLCSPLLLLGPFLRFGGFLILWVQYHKLRNEHFSCSLPKYPIGGPNTSLSLISHCSSLQVNDLNVSHIDPQEITKFGDWLSATYGVTVATHQGKVHYYLVVMFDFSIEGKVMVNMIEYIKNIVANFPEEIIALNTSPVADHLLEVQEELKAKPLAEEQAMTFHDTTMQLLSLRTNTRQDMQPATTFFSKFE